MAKVLLGKRTVEVEDFKEVCDGCGREFGLPAEPDRSWFVETDAMVQFSFGYSSEHDMGYGEFKFCPKCASRVWFLIHNQFPALELKYRGAWD